ERPRHADADDRRGAHLRLEVLDQCRDRPEGRGIVVPWSGHAAARAHRSVVAEDGRLDLGAAEIDADARRQWREAERPSRARAWTSAPARTVPTWMLTVSAGLDAYPPASVTATGTPA